MSSRLETLAQNYTHDELVYALAMKACTNACDMLSDFVKDPQYIAAQGFPTHDTFLHEADTYIMYTMPQIFMDEIEMDSITRNEADGDLDFAMRMAIRLVLRQYPKLAQLNVDLSR